MKINDKIKIQDFKSKEIIEGIVIKIKKIDLEKIIYINTRTYELIINESVLNTCYKSIK